MQKIEVQPLGEHEYAVTLTEGAAGTDTTNHHVTVPDDLFDELVPVPDGLSEADLVRESIAYLLDRVPGDAIEHEVDLEEIADTHDDYSSEVVSRLGLA
ncbi:hypothetical protein [Cryptosporangium phraense]|uniref:hypothetical protein n=1 Tax=Cryptosporangium phraense TaxID=2593070 RepID=UPI001478B3D9|nr:hypothetical protein [Cryptosporangium phraense]